MDDEEVGWAVEGNDLALELLPQGSLCGDHHAYRELLAAGFHAAAGAAARWSMGVGGEGVRGVSGNSVRNSYSG
jgi:hypothetical protein